jgi:hypothetical protein
MFTFLPDATHISPVEKFFWIHNQQQETVTMNCHQITQAIHSA